MLFKNILLAAGIVGAASAQSQQSGAEQATTAMASGMSGMPSGTMMSMPSGSASKSGKKTHSPIPVPSDLSGGFKTDQISLKVHWGKGGKKKDGKKGKGKKDMSSMSMNGAATGTSSADAAKGTDGKKKDKKGKKGKKHHKLNMKNTAKAPKFALGKHDGATEQSKWIIVMIDTTSQTNRILHYVHSDYMMVQGKGNNSNGGMGQMMQGQQQQGQNMAGGMMNGMMKQKAQPINSTTQPQMPWKGPGTMGDMGGKRQYTFLMYSQQGDFQAKGMPQPGQSIDMKDFVSQNGLQPAVAGKSVMVDTSSNGTKSSGAGGAAATDGPAVKAATGAASSIRSQIYGAGAVSAVCALAMALL